MIDIKPLDDVMQHFQWVFIAYVVLFIIVCINLYKAIKVRKNLINNNAVSYTHLDVYKRQRFC